MENFTMTAIQKNTERAEALKRFEIIFLEAYRSKAEISFWVEIINDLIQGAGFNYSRIAYRIRCSPSTIQKLANNARRKPRRSVLKPLIALYYKVFQGEYASPKAKAYWAEKQGLSS